MFHEKNSIANTDELIMKSKTSKTNKTKCLSCSLQLNKLKKLCEQKGLQTSFTNTTCAKHHDTVVLFYNNCKCKKFMKRIQNSLTKSVYLAIKQISKTKKKRKVNQNPKLDEFIVDDLAVLAPGQSKESIEIEQPMQMIDLNTSNRSSETEIFHDKPEIKTQSLHSIAPEAEPATNIYACREQDSLGLLKLTQTQAQRDMKPIGSVRNWTACGYPYINELAESEYDITEINERVNREYAKPEIDERAEQPRHWISPGLSPIFA